MGNGERCKRCRKKWLPHPNTAPTVQGAQCGHAPGAPCSTGSGDGSAEDTVLLVSTEKHPWPAGPSMGPWLRRLFATWEQQRHASMAHSGPGWSQQEDRDADTFWGSVQQFCTHNPAEDGHKTCQPLASAQLGAPCNCLSLTLSQSRMHRSGTMLQIQTQSPIAECPWGPSPATAHNWG